MHYFSWLERTIETALAGSQIGRTVFVRAHLELTADHGLLIPICEAGLSIAGRWVGADVRRIYALGGVKHGSVSLQVQFADGQTSLLSAELTHGGEPVVHLLIAGQQGALRFDDFPEPRLLVQTIGPSTPGYRGAIERSLASGKPMPAVEAR